MILSAQDECPNLRVIGDRSNGILSGGGGIFARSVIGRSLGSSLSLGRFLSSRLIGALSSLEFLQRSFLILSRASRLLIDAGDSLAGCFGPGSGPLGVFPPPGLGTKGLIVAPIGKIALGTGELFLDWFAPMALAGTFSGFSLSRRSDRDLSLPSCTSRIRRSALVSPSTFLPRDTSRLGGFAGLGNGAGLPLFGTGAVEDDAPPLWSTLTLGALAVSEGRSDMEDLALLKDAVDACRDIDLADSPSDVTLR